MTERRPEKSLRKEVFFEKDPPKIRAKESERVLRPTNELVDIFVYYAVRRHWTRLPPNTKRQNSTNPASGSGSGTKHVTSLITKGPPPAL